MNQSREDLENKKYIDDVLNYLYEKQIQSIIVEGGKKTLELFIENNKWDEARIFVGQNKLENGKKSPKILYGGSVNSNNIDQLKDINIIDGFLVGGASQNSKKFIDIIKKTFN